MLRLTKGISKRLRKSYVVNAAYGTKSGHAIDPEAKLRTTDNKEIKAKDYFGKKKVLLVGIPGAFTPVCTADHIPGYIRRYDDFKKKGVDSVACVSVNDSFVMKAWGEHIKGIGKVDFLADHDGSFIKSLDQTVDLSQNGLGSRSGRFAALIEDGRVTKVYQESSPGELKKSSADEVLKDLQK
eukprot:TRINITY_DN1124_c0_g1_i1.p1 TRINITY_DN1124_c0_g1~~TRINITY_DN1124_c0_g1_i1.p1  ORF type:complete len:183 (-),score=38.92 TRINITY_DN1124_c0_g1_i1:55-603(-)